MNFTPMPKQKEITNIQPKKPKARKFSETTSNTPNKKLKFDEIKFEKCRSHPAENIKWFDPKSNSKCCSICLNHKEHTNLVPIELYNLKKDIIKFDFKTQKTKICYELLESKRKIDYLKMQIQQENSKVNRRVAVVKKMEHIKKNLSKQNDSEVLQEWKDYLEEIRI
eukprot:gene8569-394_t